MSRDQLIEENMNLVYYLVHRYYPTFGQDEDVIQEGMIGLIKAADTFDESKSKFSAYASVCILNQIRRYFKLQSKHQHHLSLDKVLSTSAVDDEIHSTFGDLVEDDSAMIDFEMLEDADFISKLNENEQEFMEYYLKGYKGVEIARITGNPYSTIRSRMHRLKRKWEKEYGTD